VLEPIGKNITELVSALRGRPAEARKIVSALEAGLPEAERSARHDRAAARLREGTAEHEAKLGPLQKAAAGAEAAYKAAVEATNVRAVEANAAQAQVNAAAHQLDRLRVEAERELAATVPSVLLELQADVVAAIHATGRSRAGTRAELRVIEEEPRPPRYEASMVKRWFSDGRTAAERREALAELAAEAGRLTFEPGPTIRERLPKLRARLAELLAAPVELEPQGPQAA
jgi:hypothetical protein